MVIDAELRVIEGRLPHAARNALARWDTRSGLLITLRDESGQVGFGEASPLPNYSPDDLAACHAFLAEFPWNEAFGTVASLPPLEGLRALDAFCPVELPAARFGVETALAELLARRARLPFWRWLRDGSATGRSSHPSPPESGSLSPSSELSPSVRELPPSVRELPPSVRELPPSVRELPPQARNLSAVLTGSPAHDVVTEAEQHFARGIRTFKLKIGTDLNAESALLRALRTRFGGAVKLRADANRSLTLATANEWLPRLSELGLEFLEEPVDSERLAALTSPIPLALDETLRADARTQEASLAHSSVRALVIKPMVLGGFSACAAWASRAAPHQELVISHLFDGPVALGAAAHAALVWGSTSCAAGLGHHEGLDVWPRAHLDILSDAAAVATESPGLGLRWKDGA